MAVYPEIIRRVSAGIDKIDFVGGQVKVLNPMMGSELGLNQTLRLDCCVSLILLEENGDGGVSNWRPFFFNETSGRFYSSGAGLYQNYGFGG